MPPDDRRRRSIGVPSPMSDLLASFNVKACSSARAGGTDAFAAELNPLGSAVVWATYLGGKGTDAAHAIALDATGNVWLTGTTDSPDYPNPPGWESPADWES